MGSRRVHWRKRVGVGVAHAVREDHEKAVCGLIVKADWTVAGAALRAQTPKCSRCKNKLAHGAY